MPKALVLITVACEPGALEKVVNNLKKVKRVRKVSAFNGPYDCVAHVNTTTLDKLQETVMNIKGLDGVEETVTLIEIDLG